MELSVDEIMKKFRTVPCVINSFAMPQLYLKRKEEFDNFKIDNSDTFICTYPKTGTTWTQEMVWLIANNADFEAAKVDLNCRCTFLEHSIVINMSDPNRTYPPYVLDSIKYCKNLKNPRFMKTHLPYIFLPTEIQLGYKKPKIIYVTRNPKDVCSSLYHHEILFGDFSGTFNEFCKIFLEETSMHYNPYYNHVRQFVDNQKNLNILFLKFEDMKKDLASVIKKVAHFLEVHLSEEQIEKLKEHLSFESMRNNPYVNKEPKEKDLNQKGHFMRSGKVGSYKKDMNEKMSEKFDLWIEKNFKGLDEYVYF